MKLNSFKKCFWFASIIFSFGVTAPNFASSTPSQVKSDFNGDGRSDILVLSSNNQNPFRALYYSENRGFRKQCNSAVDGECGFDNEAYMFHPLTRTLMGDFNGDGKSDILNISGDPSFTRRSLVLGTSSGFQNACVGEEDRQCGLDSESYLTHPKTQLLVADFNGDGKDDLLAISGTTQFPRRIMYLSTGRGFRTACMGQIDGSCGFDAESYMYNARTKFIAEDFNGDGKSEILVVSGDPDFPRQTVMQFNGTSFVPVCFGQRNECGLPDISNNPLSHIRLYTGSFVHQVQKKSTKDLLILQKINDKVVVNVLSYHRNKFVTACKTDPNQTIQDTVPSCGLRLSPKIFNPTERVLLGDFNGDGLTDLVSLEETNGTTGLRSYYVNKSLVNSSTIFSEVCKSNADGECGFDTEIYMNHPQTKFLVGDFAGTRRDQIFIISGHSTQSRTILVGAGDGKFQTVCVSGQADCGLSAVALNGDYKTHRRFQTFPRDVASPPVVILGSTLLSPGAKTDHLTENLQAALNSGASEIILDDYTAKTYASGPLHLQSHQILTLGNGVTLLAKSGAFQRMLDSFLSADKKRDITIRGTKDSAIRMLKDEYVNGEWRHAVSLLSSDNVTIKNITIASSGGDGIYLGDSVGNVANSTFKPYCSNIHIDRVHVDNNTRNGLSVISVVNLLVENSIFSRTRSHNTPEDQKAPGGPWAGVDLEPNHPYQKMQNILFRKNTISNNKQVGILIYLGRLFSVPQIQNPLSISFINNQLIDNGTYGFRFNSVPAVGGSILIQGGLIKETRNPVNYLNVTESPLAPKIQIEGVKITPLN